MYVEFFWKRSFVLLDPYVKVLVVQESRAVLMKKTKVQRKTTCPQFREVFTFHVSTTADDIAHTSVEFTVYDRTRILLVPQLKYL